MNALRRAWHALTASLVADDPAPEWSALDRLVSSAKPTDCPVDWRSSGKRRFVTDWTEVTP